MLHDVSRMFALQVAVTRGRGGIVTAVRHYERMFRAAGVPSACLYRGPATELLRSEHIEIVEAPRSLTSPWGRVLLRKLKIQREVRRRAASRPIMAVVHSDRALDAIRDLFPDATVVAPCHSDKSKRKRCADVVITLNPLQHAFVSVGLEGSRAHAAMIGNPYVSDLTRQSRRPEGAPRLNFCGRFILTKDPVRLLDAAKLLKRRPLPEIRFIGEGPMESDLRVAARDSPARATFPGWIPAPFADFHRGDILVLPSAWEGLPYLLQEALDAEVPVIASDIPGNRLLLGDGAHGSLFPLGDAAALAARIDEALGDVEMLRGKAAAGRQALHARYGAAAFWASLTSALGAETRDRPAMRAAS